MQPKLPPQSLEAEQFVLGGLLLDGSAWDRIADRLSQVDFYREDHRLIFGAIRDLAGAAQPIDVLTVTQRLRDTQQIEDAGGLAYVGTLANESLGPANIEAYAAIVRDKAVLRRVVTAGAKLQQLGYDGRDAAEVLDQAQAEVLAIAETVQRDEPELLATSVDPWVDELIARYETNSETTGLPTGYCRLDAMTGGLQKTDLIIIAARPSMGKTALALNIAQRTAHAGQAALIFSLEMSRKQLLNRVVAAEKRIPLDALKSPRQLEDEQMDDVKAGLERIQRLPLYVDERTGLSVHELRARARRVHRRRALSLIVVDYLQLMRGDGENRNQEIAEISQGLKGLARELDVPVVALSQLNRVSENRADRRPMMSDLRDSGAIEQDADLVMLLYRDEYYHPDGPHQGIAEVILCKQRNGPTGTVELAWLPQFNRFENLAPETPNRYERIAAAKGENSPRRPRGFSPSPNARIEVEH